MSFRVVKFKVTEEHKVETEIKKAQQELDMVLNSRNSLLREKVLEAITHTYFNTMLEVDRRSLAERAQRDRPRIDYYLRNIFFYVFTKLHRGDKVKGYEIIEELKDYLIKS